MPSRCTGRARAAVYPQPQRRPDRAKAGKRARGRDCLDDRRRQLARAQRHVRMFDSHEGRDDHWPVSLAPRQICWVNPTSQSTAADGCPPAPSPRYGHPGTCPTLGPCCGPVCAHRPTRRPGPGHHHQRRRSGQSYQTAPWPQPRLQTSVIGYDFIRRVLVHRVAGGDLGRDCCIEGRRRSAACGIIHHPAGP